MFRWLLRIVAGLALVLLIAGALLATADRWLSWALPHAAGAVGVRIGSVERRPNGGVVARDLAWGADGVRIRVDRLGIPSALSLAAHAALGGLNDSPAWRLGEVDVVLPTGVGRQASPGERRPPRPPALFDRARAALDRLDRWIPPVEVRRVSIRRGEAKRATLVVENGWFRGRRADATARWPRDGVSPEGRLSFDLSGAWRFRVDVRGSELDLRGALRRAPDGLIAEADLIREGERIEARARFSGSGWLPREASLRSDGFAFGQGPLPERWREVAPRLTDLDARWRSGEYEGRVAVEGLAPGVSPRGRRRPFSAVASFAGDRSRLEVSAFRANADGLSVDLASPLRIDLARGAVESRSRLEVRAELGEWAIPGVTGVLDGTASFAPGHAEAAALDVKLDGRGLNYRGVAIDAVKLRARGEERLRVLDRVQVAANGPFGEVEISGAVDLEAGRHNLEAHATLAPEWLEARLGAVEALDAVAVGASSKGALRRPDVAFQLDPAALRAPEVGAVELQARGRLSPERALRLDGSVSKSGARIDFAASGRRSEDGWSATIEELAWFDPERPDLRLAKPFEIAWRRPAAAARGPWAERLKVGSFRMAGKDGAEIAGAFDGGGEARFRAARLRAARVDRWLERDLPKVSARTIRVALNEWRPRLAGEAELDVAGELDPRLSGAVRLKAAFGHSGARFETVAFRIEGDPLLRGDLTVPFRFSPFASPGEPRARPIDGGRFSGSLKGALGAEESAWLGEMTGATLGEGSVEIEFGGAANDPRIAVAGELARLELPGDDAYPVLRDIVARGRLDGERARLENVAVTANDSRLRGALETDSLNLQNLLAGRMPEPRALLASARGRIEVDAWELADWAKRLPPQVRAQGRIDGSIRLEPGGRLDGGLKFADLALRPTPRLPSVEGIAGRVRFDGREARLEGAGARVGEAALRVSGSADWSDSRAPAWRIGIRGEDLPLLRTPEAVFRSDVDLRLAKDRASAPPLLSGRLGMRSSKLLVDFDPLASRTETGPGGTPPYFSVKEAPFADWRLDVKIQGDDFLRVRGPYFNASLSANFDLTGDLKSPRLIGAARTDTGDVRFPGAKAQLDQGEAYITPARPDTVQLDFSAVARRSSHVVTIDVTHTLDEPHVTFGSTPSLSNAAILRLLTTGSPEGGGLGKVGAFLGRGLMGPGSGESGFADRLSVDVGRDVSRSGRETVDVRLDLSEKLYLEGGYDRFDAYNLDMVWTLFEK